jgi:hypothetical protein
MEEKATGNGIDWEINTTHPMNISQPTLEK